MEIHDERSFVVIPSAGRFDRTARRRGDDGVGLCIRIERFEVCDGPRGPPRIAGWRPRRLHGRHGRRLCPGQSRGLSERLADDFRLFAERNPKSCPVIGESKPGRREIPELGLDLDIATDIPMYRVWRAGEMVEERPDVADLWRDDLVAFVIGCSFSFEAAMIEAGLPLRHVERGTHVAMYRTNIACRPAGPFAGPMVVSMRPLTPAQAIRAVEVTQPLSTVHGAPVHLARPDLIGITDLDRVDYGDAVPVGRMRFPSSGPAVSPRNR